MLPRDPAPKPSGRPSRSRVFTVGAVIALVACIGGYFVLRAYVYGDDAPPIPVIDELGG